MFLLPQCAQTRMAIRSSCFVGTRSGRAPTNRGAWAAFAGLADAPLGPSPRAPANGQPCFPFWFPGRWRALAKGTALAGLSYNSPSASGCIVQFIIVCGAPAGVAPRRAIGAMMATTPENGSVALPTLFCWRTAQPPRVSRATSPCRAPSFPVGVAFSCLPAPPAAARRAKRAALHPPPFWPIVRARRPPPNGRREQPVLGRAWALQQPRVEREHRLRE